MLFDTFSELDRLGRNLSSLVDRTMGGPVDVHREDDRYVISADLPGVDPGSVDVTFEGHTLTIRAERSHDNTSDERDWVVRERGSWRYLRQFSLGDDIDPDGIEAGYRDGVLTVTLPVAEGARRRKIPLGLGTSDHKELSGSSATGATQGKAEAAHSPTS